MSFVFTNVSKNPDMNTYRKKSLYIKCHGHLDPPSTIILVSILKYNLKPSQMICRLASVFLRPTINYNADHSHKITLTDNKVRELIAVEVLHTSSLNTTVVAFKLLPLGSYASMPAPSPHFKTILEIILWNGLQSCCCVTPDAISVIKMPFLYVGEQKKVVGG
jgi:hypothetical protein